MFCPNCGTQLNASGVCTNCNSNANVQSTGKTVKVVVSRVKAFLGCAVKYKVFIDGNEVGALANNSSIELNLTPGVHAISFDLWSGSSAHQITIPENCNTFYIDTRIKMGLLTNSIAITNTRCE